MRLSPRRTVSRRSLARVLVPVTVLLLGLGISGTARAERADNPSIQRMVTEEARASIVPVALALAVAQVESGFNPDALSSTGARGVMQIMPKTAREEFGVRDPDLLWDARFNIRIGVRYLASLYRQYGNRWSLALSHYNGGTLPGSGGDAVPHSYTRSYVASVLAWQRRFERDGVQVALARGGRAEEPRRPMALADSGRREREETPYWAYERPAVEQDWRRYLKVADEWLKPRAMSAREPALAQSRPETAEGGGGRPSEELSAAVRTLRESFRARLEPHDRTWVPVTGAPI